jgi:putative endonuclease
VDRKTLGALGENVAIRYLESHGYNIIARNFTSRFGEIDIVARDNNEIVFIEVKTRQNKKYGEAIEAVNYYKQVHIYKAAKYFLHLCNIDEAFSRFDVVEVYVLNRKTRINHIKQIF